MGSPKNVPRSHLFCCICWSLPSTKHSKGLWLAMNWERDWNYNDWCHTIHQDVHFNSLILKQALGKGTLDDVCVFWVCDCRRRKDDACNVQLDLLGDWRLTVGLANLKNVLVPLKIILTTHLCNWMSVLHQKTYTRKWYQGHTFQSAVSNPPSPLKSAFNADHGFVSSALSILLLYKNVWTSNIRSISC